MIDVGFQKRSSAHRTATVLVIHNRLNLFHGQVKIGFVVVQSITLRIADFVFDEIGSLFNFDNFGVGYPIVPLILLTLGGLGCLISAGFTPRLMPVNRLLILGEFCQ